MDAGTVQTIGRVTIDGQALTKSQRPIVAALALWRQDGASVEALVDAVWPYQAPPTAKPSIQNQIGRLRRTFGQHLITTSGARYRLVASTDVDVIDHVATQCCGRRFDPHDAQAIASVLAAWNGEPYADLPDHPAAHAERARLHHVQSLLVETLALSRLTGTTVDLDAAIIDLSVRTSTEPLHERAWELLVTALHLAGRRTEALGAFARFAAVLDHEVGAAPSRHFRQLRDLIDDDQPIDPAAIASQAAVLTLPGLRATA